MNDSWTYRPCVIREAGLLTLRATLMLLFVVVGSNVAHGEPTATPFDDVSSVPGNPNYQVNYNFIQFMKEQGITTGYGVATLYRPNLPATRGQAAAFMIRGVYWSLSGPGRMNIFSPDTTPYFPFDVVPYHTFFGYVQKARELMITSGKGVGFFGVDDSITWGEAAVFATRALEIRTTGRVSNDSSRFPSTCGYSHVFAGYMEKVADVLGPGGCTWVASQDFDQPMTRGAISKLVVRVAMGQSDSPPVASQGSGGGSSASREYIYLSGRPIAIETTAGSSGGGGGVIPPIDPPLRIDAPSPGGSAATVWVANSNTAFTSSATPTSWTLVNKIDYATGAPDYTYLDQGSLQSAGATSVTYRAPSTITIPVPSPDATTNGTAYSLAIKGVSGAATNFATVTVKNRDLESPWASIHLGAAPSTPSQEYAVYDPVNRKYTVAGAGDAIWYNEDKFRYVYIPWLGNAEVTARVLTPEPYLFETFAVLNPTRIERTSKAGVMFRESLTAGSRNAFMTLHANNYDPNKGQNSMSAEFQYRNSSGYSWVAGWGQPVYPPAPVWLKLQRNGDVFTAYQAGAGTGPWTQVGQVSLTGFPAAGFVGLAVSSEYVGQASTAAFDNVEVTAALQDLSVSVNSQDVSSITLTGSPRQVQFAPRVAGTSDYRVTWSVPSGIGSINSTGAYTSPASVSTPTQVQIVAASVPYPTVTGSSILTLNPGPAPLTVTPATVSLYPSQQQQFTASMQSSWAFVGTPDGTLSSSGLYTAPASSLISSSRTVTIRATSVTDGTQSSTASILLQPLAVTIAPSAATLRPGDPPLSLTASVVGSAQGVTWEWTPATGTFQTNGNSATYTAPASVASTTVVTITARSVQDSNRYGQSILTISPDLPATVGVTPINGQGYGPNTFTVTATNASQATDVYLLFNSSQFDPSFTSDFNCWIWYNRQANRLYLWNHLIGNWVNPAGDAPGGAGSKSNSYCTLNTGAAWRQDTGSQLTLSLPITFTNLSPNNMGTRRIWTSAPNGGPPSWVYQGYWNLYF